MERHLSATLPVVLAALVGISGCRPPQPQIGYFLDPAWKVATTRRVVLIELAPDKGPAEVAEGLTEALYKALQEQMLFHVDVVARTSPLCRDLPLRKRGSFSLTELQHMRRELDCDAVIFGRVTHFEPYPRQQVGLYLLMLDLRGGKLIWGVDNTWETTDKRTEDRMKDYFRDSMRDGYGPADWRMARMSPRMFHGFVAHEATMTLPGQENFAAKRQSRPSSFPEAMR